MHPMASSGVSGKLNDYEPVTTSTVEEISRTMLPASRLSQIVVHNLNAIPGPIPNSVISIPATTTTSLIDNSYAINYCDQLEFPDDVLATYNLQRIEYFIFNTSCSDIFFQCTIGQTFLLKCQSSDQAFDRLTVNCNFRTNVKECPEYDHVRHCTIRESCSENQFACCAQPQMCIDLRRRCDGHIDCADGDDENNCPSCKTDEFACVKSSRCIPASLRCNDVIDDCGDGSNMDEIGCSRNSTCLGQFVCDSNLSKSIMGSHNCIDYSKHCDGIRDCPNGEDEVNCKMGETKYLLCENQKQSVTKQKWCNGVEDCSDGSDEKYCY
uniref:Chitin-binding type-2 domain-containing protein n=1 Tax=Syphacia muris TaxID=451379 RepID=A0A0N5ALW7_9BILA